jgi:hypothetical protein
VRPAQAAGPTELGLPTMSTRDDFPRPLVDALAKRVGFRCSNPDCRQPTAGPSEEGPERTVNVGIAAHITAAAPGGARYYKALTPEQRGGIENGIWLCAKCAALPDRLRVSDRGFPSPSKDRPR